MKLAIVERDSIVKDLDKTKKKRALTIMERDSLVKELDKTKKKSSEKPEPFFYCTYGGIAEKCLDCQRNHINSPFRAEDIKNWYNPDHNISFKICVSYISNKPEDN